MPSILFTVFPLCAVLAVLAAGWCWYRDREARRAEALRAVAKRRAADPAVEGLADLYQAMLVADVARGVSKTESQTQT